MKLTPLTTRSAASYEPHQQKNDLTIGIHAMTAKVELKDLFKINLLNKGLLPILLVADNQSASENFILPKEKIFLVCEASGATNACQRRQVTSPSAGMALLVPGVVLYPGLVGMTLIFNGMKMASDAMIIQHNLADKEFYTWTLGPGEHAHGLAYFEIPTGPPPSGNYHVLVEAKNSASRETTTFDFPVTFNLPK